MIDAWQETLSCGCEVGQSRTGQRRLILSPTCREHDLHRAWAFGCASLPPRWQYTWIPSRFELWCMGAFVTFCATYGPISVWGIDNVWPGYLAVVALAWAVLMAWMLSTPKRMKAPAIAIAALLEKR